MRTVVKEDSNGKLHYDMTVHAVEAVLDSAKDKGRDESQPSNMTTTNGGGTYPSRFARHQLGSILGNDKHELNPALDSAAGYAKNNDYDIGKHNRQCLSVCLKKIAQKHPEALAKLPGLLKHGRIIKAEAGGKVFLVDDKEPLHITAIGLDYFGAAKAWIVTSYDDQKGMAPGVLASVDTKKLDLRGGLSL